MASEYRRQPRRRRQRVPPRPIFAVFEGGGAKGVAHVGALEALKANNLEPIGVAGTSAGALIAVLVAIGLEAEDVMSRFDPATNIISRYGFSPIGLLGEHDWKQLRRLRKAARRMSVFGAIAGAGAAIISGPRAAEAATSIICRLGHFSTSRIRNFVNQVIRDRLSLINEEGRLGRQIPDDVTFADLAQDWPTVIPLKIVVTDVDRASMEIFDAHRTPDVVIAEAVAASIAIPFVFKPARIPSYRDGRFVDGGLVSNLPIWGFSEEKLGYERRHFAQPPVPVVGFTLSGPRDSSSKPPKRRGPIEYLRLVADAALGGSQGIARGLVEDVLLVPLETDLGLLEFDGDAKRYQDARVAGRRAADKHLRFHLQVKPDRIRSELERVRSDVLAAINALRSDRGSAAITQLRASLLQPFGSRSLRVMESVHMQSDADDRLLLDLRGRGTAEAFREKDLRVFRLDRGAPEAEFMTKYERALVRPSVRSVVCAPIFADPEVWDLDPVDRPVPSGILAVDSDEIVTRDFKSTAVMTILVEQSAILYAAVSMEVPNG